jgi:hypothetical protein
MNERIKELIKQSTNPDYDSDDGPMNELNVEKFAELIVRECLKTCTDVENEALQNQEYKAGSAATLIKVLIKEHFGVEE